jgi:hypothetical protein
LIYPYKFNIPSFLKKFAIILAFLASYIVGGDDMTEKVFWAFLNKAFATKGHINQVLGYIDSDGQDICADNSYIGCHGILFNGYDEIPEETIIDIGSLLFDRSVSIHAKEAILMLLAHYPKRCALNLLHRYTKNPDKELAYFAKTALWECEMWNE